MPVSGTNAKRTAVIEDVDAFLAWLATMPIVISASSKNASLGRFAKNATSKPPSGTDAEFLAALKSMA